MTRIFSTLVVLGTLLFSTAGIAAAEGNLLSQSEFEARAKRLENLSERLQRMQEFQKANGINHGPTAVVPELDPSAAVSAASLLLAAGLLLSHRRKLAAS